MSVKLINPEKALIFRIVHRDNVPWIFDHGLHCKNSRVCDPEFRTIGNPELIEKRSRKTVPTPLGGTLSDYIPFYFTPYSIMMLNITTGWGGIRKCPNKDIVILVTSLHTLMEREIDFVFSDRHAYLQGAEFSSDLEDLDRIDWEILQAKDFKNDPNDPGKGQRYQAEALVYQHLPVDALMGVACYNENVGAWLEDELAKRGIELSVVVRSGWYFK